jgi:hypothetical protein
MGRRNVYSLGTYRLPRGIYRVQTRSRLAPMPAPTQTAACSTVTPKRQLKVDVARRAWISSLAGMSRRATRPIYRDTNTGTRQLGSSRYRIDIVALHPHQEGRLAMAIECDGANDQSAPTARDRHKARGVWSVGACPGRCSVPLTCPTPHLERPVLNSPCERSGRHGALDVKVRTTLKVPDLPKCSGQIASAPKQKMLRLKVQNPQLDLDHDDEMPTEKQAYDAASVNNEPRSHVDLPHRSAAWRVRTTRSRCIQITTLQQLA